MTSLPELIAALIGFSLGVAGASARRLTEIMDGWAEWVTIFLILIIITTGLMGFMGTAMAEATRDVAWSNIVSGALGASGALGFDFIIKRIAGIAGL